MTPYMWLMPNAARVCAATEYPLLPAPPAASIHAEDHVPKEKQTHLHCCCCSKNGSQGCQHQSRTSITVAQPSTNAINNMNFMPYI